MVSSSKVHRQAHGAVFELEQFIHLGRGQPGDARDAVAHLDDATDLLGRHGGVEVVHVFAQRLGDLAGANGEFGHDTVLFLVNSIQGRLEQLSRGDRLTQRTQSSASGRVEAKVADLDQHPAEQVGLIGDLEFDVLAGEGTQGADEFSLALAASRARAACTRAMRQSRARAT
jgi:hypothetical protein